MNMIWPPTFTQESHSGTREVTVRSHLLSNRKIFLQGEINSDSANEFMQQLLYLQEQGSEPIHIFLNSGGGEVLAGMMIYDLLQSVKIPVNIYCTGMAASMAAIILAGGQKGRRFILPHSKTMIHEPLISQGVGGSASSIKNISDSILQTREMLNGILSNHTGQAVTAIEEATAYDHYLNAEETVAFGICDKVITRIM